MGSPGNLMIELWKLQFNVLWVNPIPKTTLNIEKVQGKRRLLIKLILIKIKQHMKPVYYYKRGFIVFTPLYFPALESNISKRVNPKLYRLQIAFVRLVLRIQRFYLVNCTSNLVTNYINMNQCDSFIHIAADLHSDYRKANEQQRVSIEENEKVLFDLVTCIYPASNMIASKIVNKYGHKEKMYLLPHGVDFNHFNSIKNTQDVMASFPKPIIGYFGSLTLANDLEIYEEIAKLGYTFILIGDDKGDYRKLKQYNNVHFLGPIPYEDLPQYAVSFDVCVMAWKPHAWIENCNPKKTLEYLALGKPIVSITIPYLKENFREFIYFADEPLHFAEQVIRALNEDTDDLRMARMNEAKNHDWSAVIQNMLSHLNWLDQSNHKRII